MELDGGSAVVVEAVVGTPAVKRLSVGASVPAVEHAADANISVSDTALCASRRVPGRLSRVAAQRNLVRGFLRASVHKMTEAKNQAQSSAAVHQPATTTASSGFAGASKG